MKEKIDNVLSLFTPHVCMLLFALFIIIITIKNVYIYMAKKEEKKQIEHDYRKCVYDGYDTYLNGEKIKDPISFNTNKANKIEIDNGNACIYITI